MSTRAAVACVGIAVMDLVFEVDVLPDSPTKHFASSYREIGGGPAANAAVTIARLGGDAHLWARVGDEDWGRRIVDGLRAEGVRVDAVRPIPGGQSGVSAVMVDSMGERMIVNFSDPTLSPDAGWLPVETLPDFAAVLCDLRWPEAAVRALRAARDLKITGVLDADVTDREIPLAAAEAASHVVFSEPALARWSGRGDIADGLKKAAGRFGGWVAVTAGSRGAYWTVEGETVRHQPAFEVTAVDTLGAGDVFHGAFAGALAAGQTETDALRWAAGAAALKCTRPGGRAGIPTEDALRRFLKEQG